MVDPTMHGKQRDRNGTAHQDSLIAGTAQVRATLQTAGTC
jgi:hypothetical protein